MGHYPIKCIHCMREIAMDERMIRLVPENFINLNEEVNDTEQFDTLETADSDDYFSGIDLDEVELNENRKNYISISGLDAEGSIVKRNTLSIYISNEYADLSAEYHRDLVQSIEVENVTIDGKKVNGTVSKFYCPDCQSELIPQAGQLPMYLISLMGPSSAGKTVYLTVLHMLLKGRRYNLPQGCLTYEYIGGTGKEINEFSKNLVVKNKLPGTTAEDKKDPYMLKVSYRINPDSPFSNKECILGLIDMRGELLSGSKNTALSKHSVPQFKESDGFIMMVDPETLEGVYQTIPTQLGGRSIEALYDTLDNMKEVIMSYITASLGKINKPSVIALAKQDILLKYHQQLGIPLNQPVIAPGFRMIPNTHFGQQYYGPMHQSTRHCIEYLSGSFALFLSDTFDNPYFMSMSALGSQVQIRQGEVDNWRNIHPIRIEEPLLRLLMGLHFIPPFHSNDYYMNPYGTIKMWSDEFSQVQERMFQGEPVQQGKKSEKKSKWPFKSK